GEKAYGPANPFLTYRIFNVEEPLAGQGLQAGAFDLVIAANVLHATSNIRHTLRNAKAALKKHGLLLLNEMSANTLFSHLTYGLLDGWWSYNDAELRLPGCPGLSSQSWRLVLEEEGFNAIFFPADHVADVGLQIIVAESDGIVYQRTRPFRPGSLSPRGEGKEAAPHNAAWSAREHDQMLEE